MSDNHSPLTGEMRQALFALHAGLPSDVVASIFGYSSPAWIRRQKNSPEGRAYIEALDSGARAPELIALMRVAARLIVLLQSMLGHVRPSDAATALVATSLFTNRLQRVVSSLPE